MSQVLAVLIGLATFYADGVMDRVVAYRGLSCAECIGAVALLEPEHIGQQIWLQAPGREVEGPFLVADCANRAHAPALRERGFVVDVDWETAQRWGMRGPLPGVQVFFEEPDDAADAGQAQWQRRSMVGREWPDCRPGQSRADTRPC